MKKYNLIVLHFGQSTRNFTANYIRPLGPEKISWMAQKAGYSAICITRLQVLTKEQIIDLLKPYITEKTVIGISTTLILGYLYSGLEHEKLLAFADAIKILKKQYNNSIILGGQSANEFVHIFDGSTALENFDGENDIVDYLNNKFHYGIARKKIERWTIHNDNFRYPSNSFPQKEEMLPLELGRGCIFSCKFCSYSRIGKEKGSYEKSMSDVKDYIIDNYSRFGTQYYFFTADTVNDNDDRMNEWCDMIETLPFKIYYAGFFRIDLMYKYRATAKRLYETGLRGINFGIETFHPEAAKLIEKPFNGNKAKDFLLELYYDFYKEKVKISTGIIVGLPKEPIDSVLETAEWFRNEGKVILPSFNPLTLMDPKRSPEGAHYSSKFSKNADKYGLKWPSSDNRLYWTHEHMNYKKAIVLSKKFREEFEPNDIGIWNYVQFLACKGDYTFIDRYFDNYKIKS